MASIESLYKLRTGRVVSLSEQELVDCASPPNYGCGSGDPATTMWWVARNGGLATPYESKQGQCRRGRIRGGAAVPPNSEAALERAVAQQPVVVSINAVTFQHYKGGVLLGPCDAGINHAVTVVGYGADAGDHKYWIVKNSWGDAWGENGYVRMEARRGQGRLVRNRHQAVLPGDVSSTWTWIRGSNKLQIGERDASLSPVCTALQQETLEAICQRNENLEISELYVVSSKRLL